jgi:hypothetical protein
MMIIGCDYHPGFQQIALVNTETGDGDSPAKGRTFSWNSDNSLRVQ